MGPLAFEVAGESHSAGLVALVRGLPRGVPFDAALLERRLALRRELAGRGQRAAAEAEPCEVVAGITAGTTNGGPVALLLPNRDRSGRTSSPEGQPVPLLVPRPGHADLAGCLKWGLTEATPVAELASGRITAAYTALGAVCEMLLLALGVETLAHVRQVGRVKARGWRPGRGACAAAGLRAAAREAEGSRVLSLDAAAGAKMLAAIAAAREAGDTLGGEFEVVCAPVPAGLGAPQPWSERLDSRLAALVMAIPGVRAVAIGDGFVAGGARGSRFHDPIVLSRGRELVRRGNRAGGLEGGMTNGQPLVVRGVMKPIPTLGKPLASVRLGDLTARPAERVRGDVCAVPAAAVCARALVAFVLADALLAASGGSSLGEIRVHR
jgi:chorismate synthase